MLLSFSCLFCVHVDNKLDTYLRIQYNLILF